MDAVEGMDVLAARARRATVASWALLAATVTMMLFEGAEAFGSFDPAAASETVILVYLGVALAYTVAFVLSVVFVSMWIHRAHANLHEAGLDGLQFTPGWAVGWFFIPIANLWKPYQAMRELWNASTMPGGDSGASAPGALSAWWATWLIGNIVSNVSTRMSLSSDIGIYQAAAAIGAVSSAFIIVCAWLLIGLIRDITAAQQSGLHVGQVFE